MAAPMIATQVLTPEQTQQLKELVAATAVKTHCKSDSIIGLGTGSTAECAIREIASLVQEGKLRNIQCVATSVATQNLAAALGLPLIELDEVTRQGLKIAVAFDGADEVNEKGWLVKGRGAALFREKMVESLAGEFVVMVHESKLVPRFGVTGSIPLEVVSFAKETTRARVIRELTKDFPLESLRAEFRMNKVTNQHIYTDNGNLILDLFIDSERDQKFLEREWDEVDAALHQIVGVIETGLFIGLSSTIYVAQFDSQNNTASVSALPIAH